MIIYYVVIPLIASLLIILNEWLKRYLDAQREKKKYGYWLELFKKSQNKPNIAFEIDYPDDYIYELLRDGLIEITDSGTFRIKRDSSTSTND